MPVARPGLAVASASTDKALSRLFSRFGGKPIRYTAFTCADSADRHRENTLWSGCVVERVDSAGATTRLRMFAPIIAREGRFEFLSLTNGL